MPMPPRPMLNALTVPELAQLLDGRARAIEALHWLYAQPPTSNEIPDAIPGVSWKVWRRVKELCGLPKVAVVERTGSPDGTTKYLLDLDGATAETVLIPARGRSTVCVSSQAGCTRNCAFCATATLGFRRSLTAAEMIAQYRLARADAAKDAPARNVVFMGMGEPMDNLDEVLRAIEVLTQAPEPMLAAKQVTVSTSGVLPGMRRFLRESRASLALSLNASTDEQRDRLMPQNRTWPIASLLDALREDRARNPKRVHFIEYVLFSGINDADEDAARLPVLLEGINARVNLIPHNPVPGNPLRPPSDERVLAFQKRVADSGIRCLIRWPRGREVAAACGQLAATKWSEPETVGAPRERWRPIRDR
ncbi:MAG: 23S rRNA (adenine(2503)-C(2))-methyltransferase RlmN [Myxococcaceae bacterium]|nr:23S rRNA (adenine(2503)-C(2))-methyltransferase RlmN [Myxococcaceae bacterium]